MKKRIVAGVVTGVLLSAVTVSGAVPNKLVEAWLTDSVILNIGGNDMTLPEDTHVVNYDGRIYVPARYVVEEMGGTVLYNADSKRVIITKPDPEIQRVEVEKLVERETPAVQHYVEYDQAPTKVRINEMTINVFGITRDKPNTYVFFDMTFDTVLQGSSLAFLDYKNAYIEANGVRYEGIEMDNAQFWGNSIDSSTQEIKDAYLIFDPIPNDSSINEFKIVIPVTMDEYSPGAGFTQTPHVFTFLTKF